MKPKPLIPRYIDSRTFTELLEKLNDEEIELIKRSYKGLGSDDGYYLEFNVDAESKRKIQKVLSSLGMQIEAGQISGRDAMKRIAIGLGGMLMLPVMPNPIEDSD